MEETVRAFNFVVEKGWVCISPWGLLKLINLIKAFYWATSEWSAVEIEEAHRELNDSVTPQTGNSKEILQMLPPNSV